jgi:UDP-glucose 4-epimerase
MRFLLAGGAGAVSRDLNSALSGIDHEVRVLDTHADTLPISGHEKLELIRGRVGDRSLADKAVKDRDMVVHLAWSFSDDPGDLVEAT